MAKRRRRVKVPEDPDKNLRAKVIKEKCSECQYRGEMAGGKSYFCGYMLITDEPRGCDWRMCDRFIKGDKLPMTGD